MAFYIDTTDAAGVRTNGHFEAVWNLTLSREVNRVGQISFDVPASDWARAGVTFGTYYLVYSGPMLPPYTVGDGLLGSFRHQSARLDAAGEVVTITAADQLGDLANAIVGFNRSYSAGNNRLFHILEDLVADAGWTLLKEPGLADAEISCEFMGESFLAAFDILRSYVRGWFSLGSNKELRFGRWENFGDYQTLYTQSDTGSAFVDTYFGQFYYRGQSNSYDLSQVGAFLTNPPLLSDRTKNEMRFQTGGPMSPEWTIRSGLITKLTRMVDQTPIVTRVYPLGAGLGTTQVSLAQSSLTAPLTIQTAANPDGSLRYYLEHPAGVAAYGVIERVLFFSDIRPITNSDADLTEAANTLYALGLSYLNKFAAPFEVYEVECIGTPDARPGDIVLIDYRGVVHTRQGDVSTIFLDRQAFYILRVTTSYGDGGAKYTMTISSNGEESGSLDSVVANAVREIERFKAHPQPSITYYSKASPTLPISPARSVQFQFEIGPEALSANSMALEFHLMPLRSPASITELAGGAINTETSDAGSAIVTSQGGGSVVNTQVSGGGDLSNDQNAIAQRNLASAKSGSSDALYHKHSETLQNAVPLSTSSLYVYDLGGGEVGLAVFGGLVGKSLVMHGIIAPAGGLYDHTHSIGNHNHGVSLPAHTHLIELPAHSHDVDISHHTHRINLDAHSHGLTFGVVEDTDVPTGVSVLVNGLAVATITNKATGAVVGATASGAGIYGCDILAQILADSNWRTSVHRIEFVCTGGKGEVFSNLHGRITIQPIQVVP